MNVICKLWFSIIRRLFFRPTKFPLAKLNCCPPNSVAVSIQHLKHRVVSIPPRFALKTYRPRGLPWLLCFESCTGDCFCHLHTLAVEHPLCHCTGGSTVILGIMIMTSEMSSWKNTGNESWKLAVKKIIGDPIKSYQLTKVGGPSELAIHLTPQRNFQNLFPTKVFF